MFEIGDKVKINCYYFNETMNGKIGEIINISHYDELSIEDYYIVKDYYIVRVNEGDKVNILSLYPEYITKIYEATKDQITILQALYLLGYRYIACNINGVMLAYAYKPEKLNNCWTYSGDSICVNQHKNIMDGICSWDDEEPTSIYELLDDIK